MSKHSKKKTKKSTPLPLRSAICTWKFPPTSKKMKSRRKTAIATPEEVILSGAILELRKLHPEKKSIGRVLIGTFLGGILSAHVVARLLGAKKGVIYNGQNKETPAHVVHHIKFIKELRKTKSNAEIIEYSQNTCCRISRKDNRN